MLTLMPMLLLEPEPVPEPQLVPEPGPGPRLRHLLMPMLMPMPKLVPLLELKHLLIPVLIILQTHQPVLELELVIQPEAEFQLGLAVQPTERQQVELLLPAIHPVPQLEWPDHQLQELPVFLHHHRCKAFDLSEEVNLHSSLK